jgi:hypothetical protein
MADLGELHEIIRRVMAGRSTAEELRRAQQEFDGIKDVIDTSGPRLSPAPPDGPAKPLSEKDNAEATLDYYTQSLALLYQATQLKVPNGYMTSTFKGPNGETILPDPTTTLKERVQRSRECWTLMRDARVFSFQPHVYAWLHHHADRYTTEVLAGLPYHPPGQIDEIPPDETKKLVEIMFHHGKRVEFPEQWPFETVYVGFGPGVFVGEADFYERKHYYDRALNEEGGHDEMLAARTKGFLISTRNDGTVIEFAEYTFRRSDGSVNDAMIPEWYRTNGTWSRSYSLVPWIVQQINWLLNSYRKFIEEHKHTLTSRYRAKTSIKKFSGKREAAVGWLPRPYYVVTMKPEVLEEVTRSPSTGPAYRYSYRFDVRGHERVRVKRGWLPLPEKERKKLTDRGYKIYEGEIDDSDLKKLFQRQVAPKRINEWVAVLSTWVDSYQKGPENAPYIPAIRVPARGHEPS